MSAALDDTSVRWIDSSQVEAIKAVIDLGDAHRKTLGMLPHEVFYEAAKQRCLVGAFDSDTLIGYALIRLPRREISLTHLCVTPATRGRGVAERLLAEVGSVHDDRLGIRAKCRDDYGLDATWRRLGFVARAKTKGRGADQAPMTVWWRDHGHPDLFTAIEQPSVLHAGVDVDILIQLQGRFKGPDAELSQILDAPHLHDRLELVATPAVRRLSSTPGYEGLETAASTRKRRQGPPDEARRVHDEIARYLHDTRTAGSAVVDDFDVWQVAEAVAAKLPVFMTWKNSVIDRVKPVVERMTEMKILVPSYVVTHLDSITDAAAYQPQAWLGSSFTSVRAGSDIESYLPVFTTLEEGGSDALRRKLRELAGSVTPCWLIRSDDGEPLACYATEVRGRALVASVLRVNANHPLATTVARQLLWALRTEARSAQANLLTIDDPHLPELVREVCEYEGLYRGKGVYHTAIVDQVTDAARINACVSSALHAVGVAGSSAGLSAELSPAAAAQYEKLWWPAKILDSRLPTYVIPIQPRWSTGLLGEPAPVTPRPLHLALGREQVYYRRPGNNRLTAPARILWYQSQHTQLGPAQFIGVSSLDAIHLDSPEALHEAFGHYGVFSLEDIRVAAQRTGVAQAVQFSNTEIFTHPVSRRVYDRLPPEVERPQGFQSPVPISSELFARLYALGMPLSTSTGAEETIT